MQNTDEGEGQDAAPANDSPAKTKRKKIIYAAIALVLIIVVGIVVYFLLPAAKSKTVKNPIKKPAKQIVYDSATSHHQGENRHPDTKPFNATSSSHSVKPTAAVASSALLTVKPVAVVAKQKPKAADIDLRKFVTAKKQTVAPRLASRSYQRFTSKNDIAAVGAALSNMSSMLRDSHQIKKTISTPPAKNDKQSVEKGSLAANADLFIAKGWSAYYKQGGNVLLYRYFGRGAGSSVKLINTAWLLANNDITVFANAVNCSDKSIDTFAFIELDPVTLKSKNSNSRKISETGHRFESIWDKGDAALYDKVCR